MKNVVICPNEVVMPRSLVESALVQLAFVLELIEENASLADSHWEADLRRLEAELRAAVQVDEEGAEDDEEPWIEPSLSAWERNR